MPQFKDITGIRFGKLTAVSRISDGAYGKWVFRCDCGTIKTISKQNVSQGKVISCGCANKEAGVRKRTVVKETVFGRLCILKTERVSGIPMCECLCDCGKIITVVRNNLLTKHTTSCGCLRIYRHEEGSAGLGILYKQRYRHRALVAGRDFTLSLPEFKRLTQQPCFYCGALPSAVIKSKSDYSGYTYNGLDRIDSSKGYTETNVVPCCTDCNRMKLDHSQDAFAKHIEKIRQHWAQQHLLKLSAERVVASDTVSQ